MTRSTSHNLAQRLYMPQPASLQWLSLDDCRDYARYERYWESGSYRRPHDHPGFLRLMQPKHYSASVILYQHSAQARISYPFFYCELGSLAPFRTIGSGLHHLLTPYGYGGALYDGDAEHLQAASRCFEQLLVQELKSRRFVSEFIREDIFSSRLVQRTSGEVEERPNVVVRLQRTPEEIWRGYTHAVKGNIRRAQKSGLRVCFDFTGERLDCFLHVYYDTMKRRQASEDFYIPRERFEGLLESIGKQHGLMYVHVYDGDDVVASELLLLAQDTIYSFLGGSLNCAFSKRPNNLLKHEVILWGASNGYKGLVLGGGLSAHDELFRFKRSFDPDGILPFRLRKVIHDADAYASLVQARMHYEQTRENDWEPNQRFFPTFLS